MSTYKALAVGYFELAALHRDTAKTFPLYSTRRANHLRLAERIDAEGVSWAQLDPNNDHARAGCAPGGRHA